MAARAKTPRTAVVDVPIAVVAHSHPSVSKGGAEIAAYTLFQGLLSRGANAVFVAACPRESSARLDLASAREHVILYDQIEYDHFYHLALPRLSSELAAVLQSRGVRLVNFHHYLNLGVNTLRRIARRGTVSSIVTFHEYLAICNHHGQMVTRPARMLCRGGSPASCASCFPENSAQQFRFRQALLLDAFGNIDRFVSPSQFLADRYIAWGLPRDRFAVIENGLVHNAPTTSDRSRRGGERWVFGYFGQITPFKGVDTLLDAAEIIARTPELANRITLRIHGNFVGQTEAFVARLTAAVERHAFVEYAGPYENALAADLMSECDYVVVPSRWWENSPVVIQEAFAAGRPVLCSGLGGLAEKVADGVSGLHYRMGDADDLVRVMARAAVEDVHLNLRAGLPQVLDSNGMARAYLELFGDVLTQAPLGQPSQLNSVAGTFAAAGQRSRSRISA